MQSQGVCDPMAFGATVTGVILVPMETDCYSFTGQAGDRIRIRMVETLGTLFGQTVVLRPNGTVVCGTNAFRQSTRLLDTTGTHEILVRDDAGTALGDYSLY